MPFAEVGGGDEGDAVGEGAGLELGVCEERWEGGKVGRRTLGSSLRWSMSVVARYRGCWRCTYP